MDTDGGVVTNEGSRYRQVDLNVLYTLVEMAPVHIPDPSQDCLSETVKCRCEPGLLR